MFADGETIFKRADGSSVLLRVSLQTKASYANLRPEYKVVAYTRGKRKRTWQAAMNTNSYAWRSASMAQRNAIDMKNALSVASPNEIMQACKNLWEMLNPERAFSERSCTIPEDRFDPSYCAENGAWDGMTGGACICTAACKFHKQYKPLEFAGKEIL